MNKREKARVEKAFNWVQKKLNTSYAIVFQQVVAHEDSQLLGPDDYMAVIRSFRETEDKLCFIVYFDAKNLRSRSFNKLKRDCLHEMLHVIGWIRRDVFEDTVKHVKNTALRRTLSKQFYDCDESATYALERAVGPHIISQWGSTD